MRLVSICGSPGAESANRAALRHAVSHLAASGSKVSVVEGSLQDIPVFDPRLAANPPPQVMALSEQLATADGIMIAAPEYAGGLAGGTKTALDWMVGLASLYHRPVVVLSAGTSGGEHAIQQLVQTLSWQGALVVDTLGIAAPRTKMDSSGQVFDLSLAQAIEDWIHHLISAIAASPAELRHRVSHVVSNFGVDPERFGDLNSGQ